MSTPAGPRSAARPARSRGHAPARSHPPRRDDPMDDDVHTAFAATLADLVEKTLASRPKPLIAWSTRPPAERRAALSEAWAQRLTESTSARGRCGAARSGGNSRRCSGRPRSTSTGTSFTRAKTPPTGGSVTVCSTAAPEGGTLHGTPGTHPLARGTGDRVLHPSTTRRRARRSAPPHSAVPGAGRAGGAHHRRPCGPGFEILVKLERARSPGTIRDHLESAATLTDAVAAVTGLDPSTVSKAGRRRPRASPTASPVCTSPSLGWWTIRRRRRRTRAIHGGHRTREPHRQLPKSPPTRRRGRRQRDTS